MRAWVICILVLAGSYGLSKLATPQTAGSQFPLVLIAVTLVFACWRGFERLLWLRFPTEKEHTSAAKWCATTLVGALVLHGVVVALGR